MNDEPSTSECDLLAAIDRQYGPGGCPHCLEYLEERLTRQRRARSFADAEAPSCS